MTTTKGPVQAKNPAWAELLQLVPVISLALPFIITAKVDLNRAATGFWLGASLSIPVMAVVLARRHLLNPILLGTACWLWLGAAAFTVGHEPLIRWLAETQGFGLFAVVLAVGIGATLWSPHGYVGCRSSAPDWIRRASSALLVLTVAIAAFAWAFRHDIRVGGGLPFIVLNVARRGLCLRAPAPMRRHPAG